MVCLTKSSEDSYKLYSAVLEEKVNDQRAEIWYLRRRHWTRDLFAAGWTVAAVWFVSLVIQGWW